MYQIQMTREEAVLTARALKELRERGEITRAENDVVINLVHYIEVETK